MINPQPASQRDALNAAVQARDLAQLKAFVAEYNLLPPPWVILPHAHPIDLAWDEGYGKSFTQLWGEWWQSQAWSEAEQVEYFREFTPPHAWLEWVLFALWPDVRQIYWLDDSEGYDVLLPYFERLEALGFGSYADWRTDYERVDWP